LQYCLGKLATADGSPVPPVKAPAPRRRFDPDAQPAFEPQGTKRLRAWLNRINKLDSQQHNGFDTATAYLALLQSWLDLNGISWPSRGVFAADLSSGGKGRPVDASGENLRKRCYELHKQGKTWKEIAQKALPGVPNRIEAQRKAKDYARSYAKRKPGRPDIEDFRDEAYELLGIERYPSLDDY